MSQRSEALLRANEIRLAGAKVRRLVADGALSVQQVIRGDVPAGLAEGAGSLVVARLVEVAPGMGKSRISQLANKPGVQLMRRVRDTKYGARRGLLSGLEDLLPERTPVE